MAMARKPLLKPDAFFGLRPEEQQKEIHTALANIPSGRIVSEILEETGHVFMPADERNKKSLKSAIGYHGADGHAQAIERAVSNYITDRMNGGLVHVEAHAHNGVQGFAVLAKKLNPAAKK